MILCLLADIRTAPYRPFLDPMWGAWSDRVWPLLLLPLCVAVAIVYKSIKCRSMSEVPRQAAAITVWIVLGMVAAGAVLVSIVKGIDHFRG
jgi:hypothetical protein